jgi:transcription initiation factor TFIID subunit TAF12
MQELHKISAEQKVKKAEQKIVDQQFLGRRNEQLIKMMELIEVVFAFPHFLHIPSTYLYLF